MSARDSQAGARDSEALEPSSIDAVAPGPADVPGFNPPTALLWFGVSGGAFAWAPVVPKSAPAIPSATRKTRFIGSV